MTAEDVASVLEALREPVGKGTVAVAGTEVPVSGWSHVGRVTAEAFLR